MPATPAAQEEQHKSGNEPMTFEGWFAKCRCDSSQAVFRPCVHGYQGQLVRGCRLFNTDLTHRALFTD
jgi:hypothetical protein